jgi:hypothetical protein
LAKTFICSVVEQIQENTFDTNAIAEIIRFRRRLPSGADETIDSPSEGLELKQHLYENSLSGITFGIYARNAIVWSMWVLEYWG